MQTGVKQEAHCAETKNKSGCISIKVTSFE
jgi:hypothetical protein